MNILFIDDDTDLHRYYQAVVSVIPDVDKVITVDTERKFLYALDKHRVDLIISDLHMEPKSGAEILGDNKDRLTGIGIVLLSCADFLHGIGDELREQGVNIVAEFQKPLDPDELYDLLGFPTTK
jgi:response regulator of citrate/malate metabolism